MIIPRPNLHKYKTKPETHICNKCCVEKPFTSDYFWPHIRRKFGLNFVCKKCDSLRRETQRKNDKIGDRKRRKNWEESNRAQGLCIKCTTIRNPNHNSFCDKHIFQDYAHSSLGSKKHWIILKERLEKQNYKCAYTGIDLILGINASVDHIKSKSLHPENRYDKDNVQWIDIKVNRMKREHDEEDFLNICKTIVEYNKNKYA